MGGVVKVVEKVTREVERASKKAVNIVDKLVVRPALIPTRLARTLGKVAIQGKSFKKNFAKDIQYMAKTLANIYDIVGNKWLGINDDRFLGIKDKNLRRLGKVVKDVLHDDAVQTVGFGIVALAILVTLPVAEFAGEFIGEFVGVTLSEVIASEMVAATAGAMADIIVSSVVVFGLSYLYAGLADAAVMAIYGNDIKNALNDYEKAQENLRLTNLNDILNGSIFDKMAGGYLYASQFAGNIYYDATTPGNCNISVGGEFNLSPHCIRTNIGYIDSTLKNLAGDDGFSVISMSLDTN